MQTWRSRSGNVLLWLHLQVISLPPCVAVTLLQSRQPCKWRCVEKAFGSSGQPSLYIASPRWRQPLGWDLFACRHYHTSVTTTAWCSVTWVFAYASTPPWTIAVGTQAPAALKVLTCRRPAGNVCILNQPRNCVHSFHINAIKVLAVARAWSPKSSPAVRWSWGETCGVHAREPVHVCPLITKKKKKKSLRTFVVRGTFRAQSMNCKAGETSALHVVVEVKVRLVGAQQLSSNCHRIQTSSETCLEPPLNTFIKRTHFINFTSLREQSSLLLLAPLFMTREISHTILESALWDVIMDTCASAKLLRTPTAKSFFHPLRPHLAAPCFYPLPYM